MGSSFGINYRLTTFGESHGPAIGGVIDGCPAQTVIDPSVLAAQMQRRRPGQSRYTTQRRESDEVRFVSGLQDAGDGRLAALGTPIGFLIDNQDTRPQDYGAMASALRPSHADYTYLRKYGLAAASGGGRASARETAARVVGGVVAEAVLHKLGIEIVAWVSQVHVAQAPAPDFATISRAQVDGSLVRCPNPATSAEMETIIEAARKSGDSVGGVITCVARGVPPGLGEPVFDKLDAELAKAMLGLPAAKGFELGSGFAGTTMFGSSHNDAFVTDATGRIRTMTNHSGGVQGGISNGEPIWFRVAFKPTATIARPQTTVTPAGEATELAAKGRHDPCVLPRAVPIVEAMTAMVLCDLHLRQLRNTTASGAGNG